MRRIIGTYLLIVLLVSCPYICLDDCLDDGENSAESVRAPEAASCQAHCCGHGIQLQEQPQPAPANTPSDDEQDCLCEGAVMAAPVRMVEFEFLTPWICFVGSSPTPLTHVSCIDDTRHAPLPASSPVAWCALSGRFLL